MRLVVVLAALALVSCGVNSKPEVDPGQKSGIVGGTLVKDSASLASGIVGIYDDTDGGFICTGSLIAEDIVLTAAHCVVSSNPAKMKIVFSTDLFMILGAKEPDAVQYIRQVTKIKFHEKYNEPEQEENPFDWSDIALIKFKGSLPEGYKPATLLTDKSLLVPGLEVVMAGYGVSKVDLDPVNPKKIKNLDEAIANGDVICDDERKECFKVEMSGDGELRETKAPIAYVIRSEVRLDESKGHSTCSGDSGGPVYIEKDGQYLLFGITSRGSQLCDSVGVYTNAVYYKDWIDFTIKNMK